MTITAEKLQLILEAAIMVAGRPLTIGHMQKLFDEGHEPEVSEIKEALRVLAEKYQAQSGVELKEVASGYQFQAKTDYSHWLSRLWEERAPRYSRAFLETLALVAYRQPITRAEIEEIRGVSASSHIIKTLQDREWIRVLGYKEVPGKPALYGTTKVFLDYFNLKSLDELPTLAELKDLATQEAKLQVELDLENAATATQTTVTLGDTEANETEVSNEQENNSVDIQNAEETVLTEIDETEVSSLEQENDTTESNESDAALNDAESIEMEISSVEQESDEPILHENLSTESSE